MHSVVIVIGCLYQHFLNGIMMFDPKYQPIIFAFLMALLMSCLMSLVITVHNIGFVPNILWIWLNAWAFAFVVAFPAVMVVAPIVRTLVTKLVRAA